MTTLCLALLSAAGVHFLYSGITGTNKSIKPTRLIDLYTSVRQRLDDWLIQAGLGDVEKKQLSLLVMGLFAGGVLFGWILFGGVLAALLVGLFSSTFPIASYRQRRQRRRSEAAEAWPRMIEEIRLLCGSLGKPIPQALLEVGKQGPVDLREAFLEAEREWRISTDFEQTIAVLKEKLADPTADATCETLLVAHQLGGTDIEKRLAALGTDRQADLQGRKDARAKQAGVRFARKFVLIVPLGMAITGLSIGEGREAYRSSSGQMGVAIGLFILAACWWWAGRLIRLPQEERVFRA